MDEGPEHTKPICLRVYARSKLCLTLGQWWEVLIDGSGQHGSRLHTGRFINAGDRGLRWQDQERQTSRSLPLGERVAISTVLRVECFNHRRLYEYCGEILSVELKTALRS